VNDMNKYAISIDFNIVFTYIIEIDFP